MESGVSPFIAKMTQTRDEVISAFKSVDPNVAIDEHKQTMTRKTSWF